MYIKISRKFSTERSTYTFNKIPVCSYWAFYTLNKSFLIIFYCSAILPSTRLTKLFP